MDLPSHSLFLFSASVSTPSQREHETEKEHLAREMAADKQRQELKLAALLSKPEAVAEALRVPRARVVPAAGAALLRALAALHAAGVVHRDVKVRK